MGKDTGFDLLESSACPNNVDGHWREAIFRNMDGLTLHAYDVAPRSGRPCRGVVILVHGVRSHAMYDFMLANDEGNHCVFQGSIGDQLSAAGFHVFAYDQQSHGLSAGARGKRCFVEKFDDFADDLIQFARLGKEAASAGVEGNAELPLFGVGESMGGGCLFRAAQLNQALFTGLVFLAPMISVEKIAKQPLNRILRPVGGCLSWLIPTAKLLYMPPCKKFPELSVQFDADPLNDARSQFLRCRTAMEMSGFCETAVRSCSLIQTPFITFHSCDDTLVDPESSEVLYRDASTDDKEFVHVDHMWHALLHEPGAEKVLAKILGWLEAHTSLVQC